MTFKEFELKDKCYFIAMEYYGLILNRTYLILLTEDSLIGLKANGLVSVEGGKDILTQEASRYLAIRGDLKNPFSYVKGKYLEKIENEDLFGDEIIEKHKPNFRIKYKDISKVTYDSRKKWGMGYYPHDGKVYVTANNKNAN